MNKPILLSVTFEQIGRWTNGRIRNDVVNFVRTNITAVPLTFTTTRIGLGCSFDGERHRLELRLLCLVSRTG
jgi:hypothetical protein